MASIFKPTYTKIAPETGKRIKRKAKKWYVQYRDSDGIVRRVPGYADKEATRQLGAKLEKQSARNEVGLVDQFEEHRKRLLSEHVEDYRRYLTNKGNTVEHVQLTCGRILKINEACGFNRIADIAESRVADWLAEQRDSGAISVQTSNYYATAIKGFCRWLVRDRRTEGNALVHLSGLNAKTDRRIERRALSEVDFGALVRAAGSAQPFRELSGYDRRMLYLTAAYTGFRAGELRSLTPSSFDLESEQPCVTVAAGYSKRRRQDAQPMRADLANELRAWLAGKPSNEPVWPGTWHKDAAEMVRRDLKAAGLSYADDDGKIFDFHAFRHQFISSLAAAGIHPKVAQQLARHSTIGLTMDRYTHLSVHDVAAAVNRLPGLPSVQPAAESHKATGTNGRLALGLAQTADVASHRLALADAGSDGAETGQVRDGIRFAAEWHPSVADAKMRLLGLEPRTYGLKVRCSTD